MEVTDNKMRVAPLDAKGIPNRNHKVNNPTNLRQLGCVLNNLTDHRRCVLLHTHRVANKGKVRRGRTMTQ